MSMRILIGADPEVFVKDRRTNQFVSAHGMIPGDKKNPHKVEYGAIQVDGNALEFNIDPADSVDSFRGNIAAVTKQLRRYLPDWAEIVITPVALFEQAYFDALPAVCKELGCDPDFNAYTGEVNVRPHTDLPMRTAAGHIHIGWCDNADVADINHILDCREVVKQLDYYLGAYSLMWDHDSQRRTLYGKAGAFRPKPYGVEYRTLSNAWLTTQSLTSWVYNATYKAIRDMERGRYAYKQNGNLAREIIDNNLTDWPNNEGMSYALSRACQHNIAPPVTSLKKVAA